MILSVLSEDIETKPSPAPDYLNSFSFCNWNLNTIVAQNFINMSIFQTYHSIHKSDIICLSETYLGNSYHSDQDQLALPGYNLIRADNPNNIKRGGVCIYYIETYFTSKSS